MQSCGVRGTEQRASERSRDGNRIDPRATAIPKNVLLRATAHIVDAGEPERHHMEWVKYPRGVGQASRKRRTAAMEGIQRRHFDPPTPLG